MAVQQIGGTHYEAVYQHWDWVIDAQIGYLAACASKYVTRWRKKNGLQDLEKAKSYIDKIIETRHLPGSYWHYREMKPIHRQMTERFLQVNNVDKVESEIIWCLAGDCNHDAMEFAIGEINHLIGELANTPPQAHKGAAAGVTPGRGNTMAQQALRTAPDTFDNTGQAMPYGYSPKEEFD